MSISIYRIRLVWIKAFKKRSLVCWSLGLIPRYLPRSLIQLSSRNLGHW